MMWVVRLHDDFKREFDQLNESVQDAILAGGVLLQEFGPRLAGLMSMRSQGRGTQT